MLEQLDKTLFIALNTWSTSPVLDCFFVTITTPRNWIAPLIVLALNALFGVVRNESGKLRITLRPNWKYTLSAIGLTVLAVAISDPFCHRILKPLFGRLRPCHPEHLIEGARYLLGYRRSLSMPSIHAANMFAAATLLSCFFPKRWWWFYVPAALVAFSRVYVGVHFPGDVLAGALVGGAIAGAIFGAYRWAVVRAGASGAPPDAS